MLLIPWKKFTSDAHAETIKWSQGNSKYEIYISVLEDIELKCVLPHCMDDVRTKIEQVVSTEAHLSPSLFRVFPRTISNVLRTIWEVLLQDEDHDKETVNGFERCILAFLASHATVEDRYEIVAQLRSPQKPREIKVQSFYYRLCKMNGYVNSLLGEKSRRSMRIKLSKPFLTQCHQHMSRTLHSSRAFQQLNDIGASLALLSPTRNTRCSQAN
jgi:hypothetical protein